MRLTRAASRLALDSRRARSIHPSTANTTGATWPDLVPLLDWFSLIPDQTIVAAYTWRVSTACDGEPTVEARK